MDRSTPKKPFSTLNAFGVLREMPLSLLDLGFLGFFCLFVFLRSNCCCACLSLFSHEIGPGQMHCCFAVLLNQKTFVQHANEHLV